MIILCSYYCWIRVSAGTPGQENWLMGPDKETVITVTASSVPGHSLGRNNHNLQAFINVDVDVEAGAVDTRRTPM
jgi:hypothetical protein